MQSDNNIARIKVATTALRSGLLNGGYELSQSFGIDFGYTYNGFDQVKRMDFLPDTLLMRNNLHGLNGGFHYVKAGAAHSDAVNFSAGYQTSLTSGLNLDQNAFHNYFAMLSNVYSITASQLSINTSLSGFGSGGSYGSSWSVGGNAGVSKSLFNRKLAATAGAGYFANIYSGSNGSTITGNATLSYRSSKHHSFSLAGNFTHTTTTGSSFSLYRGVTSYNYTF